MARDDALVRSLGTPERSGEGVLRFYRWRRPTLSFGRNEPAAPYGDARTLAEAGLEVVRRPTGGRAVLHDRELTYSICAPIAAFDSLRHAYREVNAALVDGLHALGVEVRLAGEPEGRAPSPDAGPCFREPAGDEVILNGRKLVGSAQVRVGRHLLQHGSILLYDDQQRLAGLRGEASGDAPATLSEALEPLPSIDRVVDALAAGFRGRFDGDWRTGVVADSLAPSLLTERRRLYRSPEWTWRRQQPRP